MGLLRRLLSFGFAAGMVAGGSMAQTSVASGGALGGLPLGWDPRLVAWAAHDAVASGDGSQIQRLLSLASQWPALSGQSTDGANPAELAMQRQDERDAMAAVVDALIQMKVAVPVDTLRGLAADFGNDVAVLLSRMPPEQAGALSFEFYRDQAEQNYGLRYVSAALLALHPVPGFAADLIGKVKVQATVLVVLPGGLGGVGGGSSSCGGSFGEFTRSDWPMIGQYSLYEGKDYGDLQLVGGIDPVYARPFESSHYRGSFSAVSLGPNQRVRLIAEMLEISAEDIPWKTMVDRTIEFESPGQFEGALTDFVNEQQEMHRATVAALEARKLLTVSEAERSLPQLEVILNDGRGEDAEPLPDRLELPFGVTLVPR